MKTWYINYNGQQIGPMTCDELMAYRPTPETLVWQQGMAEWKPLYNFPELMSKLNGAGGAAARPGTTDKDKTTAGILALLVGGLGIHFFYMGKTQAGLICLLLTLVTCGLWSIVPFIQGIMMLTMTQEEFERKYVLSTSSFPLF